jgi:hypothetical protein
VAHYSTLLIIPAQLLWRDRRHLGLPTVPAIGLIVAGLMPADYSTSLIAAGLYWVAMSTVPLLNRPAGLDRDHPEQGDRPGNEIVELKT